MSNDITTREATQIEEQKNQLCPTLKNIEPICSYCGRCMDISLIGIDDETLDPYHAFTLTRDKPTFDQRLICIDCMFELFDKILGKPKAE